MIIISSFLYNAAMGPLTNTLCAEIPSSLLRSKSVALARWVYAVTSLVAGIIQPYMTNPDSWNWGAKSGFFWAGGCLLSVIFAYFYVPETKGRTTPEMDILFEKRVPAWRTAKYKVELMEAVDDRFAYELDKLMEDAPGSGNAEQGVGTGLNPGASWKTFEGEAFRRNSHPPQNNLLSGMFVHGVSVSVP
jgi:MFS family permease